MNRIVKVVSFPANYWGRKGASDFSELEDIQFEDEDGVRFSMRAVHCSSRLKVGCWYERYVISSIGQLYGFTYLQDRNQPSANFEEPATLTTENVTVVEVPDAANDDHFVLRSTDDSLLRIAMESVTDYFTVGDVGIATVRVTRLHRTVESLRLPDGVISDFPIAPGTVSWRRGRAVVHTGYRWLSLKDALDTELCALSSVGTLISSLKLCDGAIGSPHEYSINAYLWKVGRQFVVDASENFSREYAVFSRRVEADHFMYELRREFWAR